MAVTAYYAVNTGFGPWDDEGFLLLSLRDFLERGGLYDEVYSQYGPLYHELWGGLFQLVGHPVSHDTGRLIVLALWVGTASLLGLVAQRLTGRLLLGLAVTALTFGVTSRVSSEPMHPGATICGLLALLALALALVPARRVPALAATGALVAAIGLVKVNVGVFAAVGVALALMAVMAPRRWPVVEAVAVLLPFALMADGLDQGWALSYAIQVAGGVLALVIVLRATGPPAEPAGSGWLRPLALGLLGCAAIVLAGALLTGSSPGGLWQGIVLGPLRTGTNFTAPLERSDVALAAGLLAPVVAGALVLFGRDAGALAGGLVRIGAGLVICFSAAAWPLLDEGATGPLSLGPMLAWVAALPPRGSRPGAPERFARVALVAVAVLQVLHAYPVASSQLGFARLLFPLVGALCIADGLGALQVDRVRARAVAAWVGCAVFAAWAFNSFVWKPLDVARYVYRAYEPLPFAGATRVHVPPNDAALYAGVVDAMQRSGCRSFLSMPGLGSFRFWSRIPMPTGYNSGHWWDTVPEADQARTVEAARRTPGLCLLRGQRYVEFWHPGGPLPRTPLVDYIEEEFSRPGWPVPPYEIVPPR